MTDTTGQGSSDHPVTDIVDRLAKTAEAERVSIGDVVQAFGRRSFLPLLLAPAMLIVSPLSGIPLFSSLTGITIALIAAQMLWPGRDTLWLPRFMLRRNVNGAKMRAGILRLCRIAHWLDTRAEERLCWLVLRPYNRIVETACFLCGAAMPFLEFVPFSSSLLGLAVTLMGFGLLARDGLFAILGIGLMGGVFAALFSLLNFAGLALWG